MKTLRSFLVLTLLAVSCVHASAQAVTIPLGDWVVSQKQYRGVLRVYNARNADLVSAAQAAGTLIQASGSGYPVGAILTLVDSGTATTAMTFTVTSVNESGGNTGVSLLNPSFYETHQAAQNHQTTVSPAGGSGAVLRVNFYTGVGDFMTRNGSVLDNAATSWMQELAQAQVAAIQAAIPTATVADIRAIATRLGITLPE